MPDTLPAIALDPRLAEHFPAVGPEIHGLFQAALNEGATWTDLWTLRDWLELTDLEADAGLHALLLALFLAHQEGSLCLELQPQRLTRLFADLVDEAAAARWAERSLASLRKCTAEELVGRVGCADRPVLRHAAGRQEFLYFHRFHQEEQAFVEALNKRRADPNRQDRASAPADRLRDVVRDVLEQRPMVRNGEPLRLDDQQRLAVGLGLLRDLVIVSGGPGTGKTSLVVTLLRCLARCGIVPERMLLAAPTGRAAQRLGDSLRQGLEACRRPGEDLPSADAGLVGLQPSTLHQLLAYSPTRGTFRRHEENPVPADVVVVDEASMIGIGLLAQLFRALPPSCRLVLLGDKDQLPSVEAGAVLAHLVPGPEGVGYSEETTGALGELNLELGDLARGKPPLQDGVVLLARNHRSQQDIVRLAERINRQEPALLDDLPRCDALQDALAEGCWWWEQERRPDRQRQRFLQDWAAGAYDSADAQGASLRELATEHVLDPLRLDEPVSRALLERMFRLLESRRILTLIREGPWGAEGINRSLEILLRPRFDPRGGAELFPGAPVLIRRNDSLRGLFNGEVGLTLRTRQGLQVVFRRGGGFVAHAADGLPPHELGFALTVHKSQGSEYDHVVVVFPPEGARRLLTRELVYTAVTRARRQVVLFGTRAALTAAIARRCERAAGLLLEFHPSPPIVPVPLAPAALEGQAVQGDLF